uniref:AMOP domain-containing protein n=1 Tax=Trichuris muris TaxID=70415 RepID=A0A5S6QTX0_TRIMR
MGLLVFSAFLVAHTLVLVYHGAVAQFPPQLDPNEGVRTDFQPSPFNILTGFEPRPPGTGVNPDGQAFRISGQNLKTIDWTTIDRRAEEGWWHLYQFGERYYDIDITWRPWRDLQVDLDFFLPFYGFRFNYTFVFPEGFVAFSYPHYIQPPYTMPNRHWPDEPDSSLVAAFMSEQSFVHVGDTRLSHVWYRVVSRPISMINPFGSEFSFRPQQQTFVGLTLPPELAGHRIPTRTYAGQQLKTAYGRIEDPELLDIITRDIQHGMVGARGFKADYALIVTWERMGYGGAPKITELNLYDTVKKWQNTYQMVIATDEIRTYVMFNYANVNWTSSTQAGALFGRGGKQSAMVGFNGGNGTGWYSLPWSADGNSYKLVQYGSTQVAGRWLARVDEEIEYGGCSNNSIGILQLDKPQATMLGGFTLNVTGPCFRITDVLKMQIDENTLDCERLDMVMARCVVPVNSIFKTGQVIIRLSVDGGKNYPWWNKFYVLMPSLARRHVNLINDPVALKNNWRSFNPDNLTLTWPNYNISVNPNAQVDITLWGYWEDVLGHSFVEVGSIARNTPNRGSYSFNPRTLAKTDMMRDAWRQFSGGLVQVRVSQDWMKDRGDGIYWSDLVPFGWYFHDVWQYQLGSNWATDMCIDWFQYDGRRENFYMFLENKQPCPCTLDQAMVDIGRYVALSDCDINGDHRCYYTQGAQHCVVATRSVWTGAGQVCCYDWQGWLMFSQDFEFNDQYLRFYSAGVPYRAHPWGSFPYKRPPYVPSLSNFYNDLLPYEYCCKWAGHCEFYFWRRMTSGCQDYRPPAVGYIYGEGHMITYDGTRYTFNGKGYYVLTMLKSRSNNMMVQVRMEQPPKTMWNTNVLATAVTGVAAQDNDSAIVEIYARKEFRRWRYKTDVYVDNARVFFDTPWQKLQTFKGVTIRSRPRNMNMSELEVMFDTGLGLVVEEARGTLNVIVSVPPEYNETYAYRTDTYGYPRTEPATGIFGTGKCANFYRTMGLLGTFNNDKRDDLTTPDCNVVNTNYPASEIEARNVYYEFGERWRADGIRHQLLFQTKFQPIYNPISFASSHYQPIFDPWRNQNATFWESLIFSREEVQVTCQGSPSCEFDYLTTGRREIGIDTLMNERKFEELKRLGEKKTISCGPLQKNIGVLKYPPGNSYLDGVTVTFTCQPEYFLHGDQQRTCINGTWSPGWWPWCRWRDEEYALKWFTGIIVSLLILGAIIAIFWYCNSLKKQKQKQRGRPYAIGSYAPRTIKDPNLAKSAHNQSHQLPPTVQEPQKIGNTHNGRTAMPRFSETTA